MAATSKVELQIAECSFNVKIGCVSASHSNSWNVWEIQEKLISLRAEDF